MPHETLLGSSCYTTSDAEKLKDLINKTSPVKVKQIQGQWIYYIDLTIPIEGIIHQIDGLLQDFGSPTPASPESAANVVTIYATPRYISPWSSKATSIAQVCGLRETVLRIERGRRISITFEGAVEQGQESTFRDALYDRMTETFTVEQPSMVQMFESKPPSSLVAVNIFADGQEPLQVLRDYNQKKGLSLDESEMKYLVDVFTKLGRPPHDVELFMFAQVNSEYAFIL